MFDMNNEKIRLTKDVYNKQRAIIYNSPLFSRQSSCTKIENNKALKNFVEGFFFSY
jgi:hypothetical protein